MLAGLGQARRGWLLPLVQGQAARIGHRRNRVLLILLQMVEICQLVWKLSLSAVRQLVVEGVFLQARVAAAQIHSLMSLQDLFLAQDGAGLEIVQSFGINHGKVEVCLLFSRTFI